MGFLVWAVLTCLGLAAGLSVSLRIGPRLALAEQLVAAVLTALTLVVGCSQLLGYSSILYAWTLGPAVALSSLALLWFTRVPRTLWHELASRVVTGVRRSVGVGSLAVALPVALLVLYLVVYIYLMPSWAWDALWYHNPITAYARQDHSLRWHDTPIPWVNSYPKNIELLALWNVIFPPDDRLLDAVQLPMSLVGVLSIAGLCRRAGARPSLAMGLALLWLLFPAVFLNIPSNYIDVACTSLWLAAVLFLTRADLTEVHLFFGSLALGLYAGSKFTGALHSVLLIPVVALILWHRIGLRAAIPRVLGVGAVIALLGGATYVRNVILFGNPMWPVRTKVFGHMLPGPHDVTSMITPPWGGPDNLAALWRSLFEPGAPYMVDIRVGGFGSLFAYLLLPGIALAFGLALWRWRQKEETPVLLAIAVLIVTALAQPAAWWCRYTLALPAAGLIAAAILLSRLPQRIAQFSLIVLTTWAVIQAWPARVGFYGAIEQLTWAAHIRPDQRAAQKFFVWQANWMWRREETIHPGDAAIYDDSVQLLYPLWRFDGQSRVLYRPFKGSADTWLKQIETDSAKWAAVRRGSPAEAALDKATWVRLGDCPRDECAIWILPERY